MQQMQKNNEVLYLIKLNLKNILISMADQSMSDVYQVDLKPLKKDKFLCKYWLRINFY